MSQETSSASENTEIVAHTETTNSFDEAIQTLAGTVDYIPALEALEIFFQHKDCYEALKQFTETFGQENRTEFLSRFLGIAVALCERNTPAFSLAFILNSIGALYRTVMKKDLEGQRHCYSFVSQNMFAKNQERTEHFVSVTLSSFEQISVYLLIDPEDPKFGFIGAANPHEEQEINKFRTFFLPPIFCTDIYNEYVRPLMEYRKEVEQMLVDAAAEGKTATLILNDDEKKEAASETKEQIVQ